MIVVLFFLCLPCYRWGCTFTFLLRMTEFYVYAGFIARLLDMNIISYSDNNIIVVLMMNNSNSRPVAPYSGVGLAAYLFSTGVA